VIQPFIGRRYEPILAAVDVIEQTKSASMNRILLICAAAGDRISSKARLSHSLVGSVLGVKLIFCPPPDGGAIKNTQNIVGHSLHVPTRLIGGTAWPMNRCGQPFTTSMLII